MFLKHPRLFGIFFQLSSTSPIHLKIGTCSLYIMLNNNFNFHPLSDSQNPYNLRLNREQALLAGSKKILYFIVRLDPEKYLAKKNYIFFFRRGYF
jgi:hypothetical protein